MHKYIKGKLNKYIILPCPCCSNNKKIINGQFLKYARKQAGLDQRTFGNLIRPKVSSSYISDIERNRRDCPENIFEVYMRLRK
jgi:hypothetical protein